MKNFPIYVAMAVTFLAISISSAFAQDEQLAGTFIYDNGNVSTTWYAVTTDSSGNIYVVGTTRVGIPDNNDFFTVKYDSSGNLLWARASNIWGGTDAQKAVAVVVDSTTGDVTVAGTDYYYFIVIRYDNDGNQYGDDDPLNPVGATPFGNYDGVGGITNDVFYYYYSNSSELTGMVGDSSGNLYCTGWDDDSYSVVTIKLDNHGHMYGDAESPDVDTTPFGDTDYWDTNGVNEVAVFNPYYDYAYAITIDPATGDLYVAGETFTGSVYSPFIIKYDNDGLLTNSYGNYDYDGGGNDVQIFYTIDGKANSIALDGSGNTVIAGVINSEGGPGKPYGAPGLGYDYLIMKHDSSGNPVEPFGDSDTDGNLANDAIIYGGDGDDEAKGVTINALGSIYVTGIYYNGTNDDIYTAKYSNTDGSLLWDDTFDSGFDDEGFAIALGSIFVVGDSDTGLNWVGLILRYGAALADLANSSGFCYIATATYGSKDADEVRSLSAFRDDYLMANPVGRMAVECYYAMAPMPANYIAGSDGLRNITRIALTPIVNSVRHPIILFVLACGLLAMGVYRFRRSG